MEALDLDRTFRPISADEAKEPDLLYGARSSGALGWGELLEMQRVIILAEAGSGKSFELEMRWRRCVEAGSLACYADVQDVARSGLAAAIKPEDVARYQAWQDDPDAICWFFIDSVDEAKEADLRFETALRALAAGISGMEERAYVLISGRFSDWDFIADRKAVEEWLAVPAEPAPIEAINHHVLIRDTLSRRTTEQPAAAEDPIQVVLMNGLDGPRVRRFATNAGVEDADAFVAAIEHGNLWRFASRPLDLEWMAKYWHANGQLGTLLEMLDASIAARLIDPKPARQRGDPLSLDEARRGLERIGAGFHFSGKETLRLPTAAFDAAATKNALAIEALLPGWPREKQLRLLQRPVFDPATLGRVRLHNDNEGAVRAYLAARWLQGRLAANCPRPVVDDLLFVDIYGHHLVRPDMTEVAAWLSLWDPATASKVIARDPYLLLTRGDPGSLSVAMRVKAIEASLRVQVGRNHWYHFGDDLFRRLADTALDPMLAPWWDEFSHKKEARHLILRLIWLGRQKDGLPIARRAAFDETLDDVSLALAAFALVAIGTDEDRRKLADHISTHAARLPRHYVLNALDHLFPRAMSVDAFFAVIDILGVDNDSERLTIHPLGTELSPELASAADLSSFLTAIVTRLGPLTGEEERSTFAQAFAEVAVVAALRLLALDPDDVPPLVTDLVLRLHDHDAYRGIGATEQQLAAAIVATPARKRRSFWQAAKLIRTHPWLKDGTPGIWQIQHLGWPGIFTMGDVDWLFDDLLTQGEPTDRQLALEALFFVWRESKSRKLLNRIKRIAADDTELSATVARWLAPAPENETIRESTKRLRKLRQRNKRRDTLRDKSWIKFIDELRSNPAVLDTLHPQTEDSADSRLVHLWDLLSSRLSSRSRRSISNVSMFEPLVGKDVAERFRKALIQFAANRMPSIPSERQQEERNSVRSFDIMGLVGTSLAAAAPAWGHRLSDKEAERAARYALIELNGFPDYMTDLIAAKPGPVAAILIAEIDCQLATEAPEAHGILDRIAYADDRIAALVGSQLRARLERDGTISPEFLSKIAAVLSKSLEAGPSDLSELLRDRALTAATPETAGIYLGLYFLLDSDAATACLEEINRNAPAPERRRLCGTLLPRVFGDQFRRAAADPAPMSFATLQTLVDVAYGAIRREEDVERVSGVVYTLDERDNAQEARNAIFQRLAETPGEATHAALLRMSSRNDSAISPDWLIELARRRAVGDAYLEAWQPKDVVQFETEFGKPPSTTADLQRLAMRHIEEIAHDLIHGRFTQGTTLRDLPDEPAVQRWLGEQFAAIQPRLYTAVREEHLADEKEPDFAFHSRVSGVTLPIEIKIADGMTVADMEQALHVQLCGQYLRHRSARHGILLLIHQKPRAAGWKIDGQSGLQPLSRVITHLENRATAIRTTSPHGPQPLIACIDVTSAPSLERGAKARKT